MTPEQQRAILESAAKACGAVIDKSFNPSFFNGSVIPYGQLVVINEQGGHSLWNPLINSADTASMCAKLEINHEHHSDYIQCLWAPQETYHVITMLKDHDNSRLKAWMHAATMVAAKIGGYENAHP